MGLRAHAEELQRAIMNDEVSAMGWPITLTDPAGLSMPLVGRSQDIAQIIDPDTGMAVSGRLATAVVNISDIVAAGFTALPVGVADGTIKPWLVGFDDINGNSHIFKVAESNPDRTLGVVVTILEAYKP